MYPGVNKIKYVNRKKNVNSKMENYNMKIELLLIAIASIATVTVANTCSYTYSIGFSSESTTTAYMYCSEGCCGTPPDYHCCSNYYYYYNYYSYYNADLTAGAITGIVLGVLVSMGILIGIIVCLVIMCRNSRLKKQRSQNAPGVIFQPQQTGTGIVTFMPGTGAPGQLNPYGVVYQPVTGIPQQTVIQPTGAITQPASGVVHGQPATQTTVPMSGIQPVCAAHAPTAQVTSKVQQTTGSPMHGHMEKSNDSPPPMYNP